MTPASAILDPASHPDLYVSSVLTLYVDLPDTPVRASVLDQHRARDWFNRGVLLSVVETALLMATLRRFCRPAGIPPLPRIRSLAYFQPVVDELLENPAPQGYLQYLRMKLRTVTDKTEPNAVQKKTIPDDR